MNILLYNSLSKKKETFAPIDSGLIKMYVCGPTVYDEPHIGNARPVIIFDLLFRLLRHKYGNDKVKYIRNITDVDDKINNIALKKYPNLDINDAIGKITERIERIFKDTSIRLGCLEPSAEPRATEHIPEMIEIIEDLIKNNKAYVSEGHVIFDINSYSNYGYLSNKSKDDLLAGARVEVAAYKRNPLDFILWKPSTIDEPFWDSPWGKGRPGWHIECSAMSSKYLGKVFDIHGGGIDLAFPHHENEIAQSCCYNNNDKMANYFIHNGTLNIEGKKMSKSTGNIILLTDTLQSYPGSVVRLNMLRTHYRQPIDWTIRSLEQTENIIRKWFSALKTINNEANEGIPKEVYESLLDDLNTPMAITHMHEYFNKKEYNKLFASLDFLGVDLKSYSDTPNKDHEIYKISESEIQELIEARNLARINRDYKKSDEIRNKLEIMGIRLKDMENGTAWEHIK